MAEDTNQNAHGDTDNDQSHNDDDKKNGHVMMRMIRMRTTITATVSMVLRMMVQYRLVISVWLLSMMTAQRCSTMYKSRYPMDGGLTKVL